MGGPSSSGSIGSVSGVRSVVAGTLPLDSYSFIEVLVRSYRPLNMTAEEYFHQFRSLTARKLLIGARNLRILKLAVYFLTSHDNCREVIELLYITLKFRSVAVNKVDRNLNGLHRNACLGWFPKPDAEPWLILHLGFSSPKVWDGLYAD